MKIYVLLFAVTLPLAIALVTSCATEAPDVYDSGLEFAPLGPDAPAPDAVDWSWTKTIPDDWQGPVLPDDVDECEDTNDTADSTDDDTPYGYDRQWWENFINCTWGWRDGNQPCL